MLRATCDTVSNMCGESVFGFRELHNLLRVVAVFRRRIRMWGMSPRLFDMLRATCDIVFIMYLR